MDLKQLGLTLPKFFINWKKSVLLNLIFENNLHSKNINKLFSKQNLIKATLKYNNMLHFPLVFLSKYLSNVSNLTIWPNVKNENQSFSLLQKYFKI